MPKTREEWFDGTGGLEIRHVTNLVLFTQDAHTVSVFSEPDVGRDDPHLLAAQRRPAARGHGPDGAAGHRPRAMAVEWWPTM